MSGRCSCRDSTDPCPTCQQRIGAAEDGGWFFDQWDDGYQVMPGGEPW